MTDRLEEIRKMIAVLRTEPLGDIDLSLADHLSWLLTQLNAKDAEIAALKEQNATLAAGQCPEVVGHEGGSVVCRLKEEREHLQVQLAGCGVAAMCNTPESMEKQRCKPGDYGWSASYGEVLKAVEREIAYREALEKIAALKEERDAYKNALRIVAEEYKDEYRNQLVDDLQEEAREVLERFKKGA